MDERLKRRLVGATVLVSLAVIFLPMLLEEPEAPGVSIVGSNIPPRPQPARGDALQSSTLPLPDDEPLIPPLPQPRPVPPLPSEDPDPVQEPPPPPPTPEPPAGLSAWVVQVASLSNRTNADRLEADLRAKGYNAFQQQVSIKGRTLFRVRVGPEADRVRAERTAERILAEFELEGRVVRYP